MNRLSSIARNALRQCCATRGKHRGQLLARCPAQHGPRANRLAAAAWQGAMLVCDPHLTSIGSMMFMTEEQRAVRDEIIRHFEALPEDYLVMAERNREALETLGVW